MATPLINGINYSWANITFVLFGVPVIGILKIDYKRKQKKENNYGIGVNPVSRGYGNIDNEGMFEIYQDEWKKIIAAAPSRDPLLIAPFDIIVSFAGRGILTDTDFLRGVEFLEDPFAASQGDTKLTVSLPLIIAQIDR